MGYRSDFLKLMAGKIPERFPATEFMMFWPETEADYSRKAGTDDLRGYFGVKAPAGIPYNFCAYPPFERKILSETENHITLINEEGVTMIQEKGTSAMPHFIEFPIKDRASFESYRKRLDPDSPERIPDLSGMREYCEREDLPSMLLIRGPFAFLRDFIKFDELMYLFIDDPQLIKDMTSFHAEFVVRLWKNVFRQHIPDIVCLGEDMAYKTSSMISPDMVKEFIFPAWKKIIGFAKNSGVKNVVLDSDGYTMEILPIAIEAGFTATLPIERAAGMDGEKMRERFPELVLIGGVNKLALAGNRNEIDEEVEKAARLYRKGRYIPGCDHSVPPIVPFDHYKYYIESLKKALTK